MILAVILILLLVSHWLFIFIVVDIPLNFVYRLLSLGYWGLALMILTFLAWCMSDE
jgi:hypothetical protein